MSSSLTTNQNYMKLAQIYQILKNNKSSSKHDIHIKIVLDSGFDINYKLPSDSPVCHKEPEYSGNTALHFLIEFHHNCKSCLDLLINYKADITIQNDIGYSPLLLAFNKGLEIKDLLHLYIKNKYFTNLKCKNRISHFHVACSIDYIEALDFYYKFDTFIIDERVNYKSPVYPGYTPLHFAVEHEQPKNIVWLLNKGANLNSKDANGITPLHLLIKKIEESALSKELLPKKLNSIFLPDDVGLTYLHISCMTDDVSLVKNFLRQNLNIDFSIKSNSSIWPGFTPLHVASRYSLDTVILLLKKGANILAKDTNGITPFDLCMKNYDLDGVIRILSKEKRHKLSRLKFTDGTKLLDFLCAMKDVYKLEKFVKRKIKNINTFIPHKSPIWPGCNILHLSVIFNIHTSFFLSQNADFTMLNADGMSPLHLAFRSNKTEIVELILDNHDKIIEDPIDRDSLSHLHIACVAERYEIVKLLLKNGYDPNLQTLCDLKYNVKGKNTPNHIKYKSNPYYTAINIDNTDLANLLKSYGANSRETNIKKSQFQTTLKLSNDFFATNEKKNTISEFDLLLKTDAKARMTDLEMYYLQEALIYERNNLVNKKLISKFNEGKRFEELRLTSLQAACLIGDYTMVKNQLKCGVDNINESIDRNSNVWPGDTALHVLFRNRLRFNIDIVELLLKNGANPTLKNANNCTPLHLCPSEHIDKVVTLLKQNFTDVNPKNNDGLSHFHLCCMTYNLFFIQEFIKKGVNVHAPVDYFADFYGGYTPLHFAAENSTAIIVELLLNCGVDPNIKATNGLTPLHLALSSKEINDDLVKSLLRHNSVDVQNTDMFGETILEAFFEHTILNDEILNLLLNKGATMKFSRFITETSEKLKIIYHAASKLEPKTFKLLIDNITDLTDSDDKGQNAIHHLILSTPWEDSCFSKQYCTNFKLLVQSGCEINHKDNRGKTALHKAVSLKNIWAARILLLLGADINIKDDKGKTPYAEVSEEPNKDQLKVEMTKHLLVLQEIGLCGDQSDCKINSDFWILDEGRNNVKKDNDKLDVKLKAEINSSLSADYFFTEQFIVSYRRMSVYQRLAIRDFCNSNDLRQNFPTIHSFINLQFGKARARTRLFEPAADAIQSLTRFVIPEPCCESIFNNLSNDDLMNLVRTDNGKLIFLPLSENC